MKHAASKWYLYMCLISACIGAGCSVKQSAPAAEEQASSMSGYGMHAWYYFTPNGFAQTDAPQHAPETAAKPWTEAVRIASAGTSGSKAIAVVNRLGIVDFSSGTPILTNDTDIFAAVTADRLLFLDGSPVFHLYRNTYFNAKTETVPAGSRPLLVRFDTDSALCIPVLTTGDIGVAPDQEVTGISLYGGEWFCAVKKTEAERTSFSYLRFASAAGAEAVPDAQSAAVTVTEIDADAFRRTQKPRDFSEAPERLQFLFNAVPDTVPFYLSCRTEYSAAPVLYDKNSDEPKSTGYTAQGNAQLTERFSVAVFSDGTTYAAGFQNGAAEGRPPVIVFRLPKLPAGFVYGEFALNSDTLYVAWEESDFYKIGRSGFIAVDLQKLLTGVL